MTQRITSHARPVVRRASRTITNQSVRRRNRRHLLPRLSTKVPWPKPTPILRGLLIICGAVLLFVGLGAVQSLGASHAVEIGELPAESSIAILSSYVESSLHQDLPAADMQPPSGTLLSAIDPIQYTVKRGDTISEIAEEFGLLIDTIISYNNISDVRSFYAGTILYIPALDRESAIDGVAYTVKRGDTLVEIAERHGVELKPILDANQLATDVIQPGDRLFIPDARMSNFELRRALGTLFIAPVAGRLTSRFGMRIDPISEKNSMHYGLDIANDTGTPVYASNDGTVRMVGNGRLYGNYVVIDHVDQYQTLYAHLSQVTAREGERISQGELVGRIGSTGYSTGPHLHFTIFKAYEPVNPLDYIKL